MWALNLNSCVWFKVERFTDDNDYYYWYLGSKLEGISCTNCSNLDHISYVLLTVGLFQTCLSIHFKRWIYYGWTLSFWFICLEANSLQRTQTPAVSPKQCISTICEWIFQTTTCTSSVPVWVALSFPLNLSRIWHLEAIDFGRFKKEKKRLV
jgi:hypothetical protein